MMIKVSQKCSVWFALVCFHYLLVVKVSASIRFTKQPSDVAAVSGSTAYLYCSATTSTKNAQLIYFWKFNGKFISHTSKHFFQTNESLSIRNFTAASHAGSYQCVASVESLGSIISRKATLQAAYLQMGSNYTATYTVKDAAYIFLDGPVINAKPDPKYYWFYNKNGTFQAIEPSNSFILKNGSLLINSVSSVHNTWFQLYISHSTVLLPWLLVASIKVKVQGIASASCPDPNIEMLNQQTTFVANEGDNLVVECLAVARKCREAVRISWIQNGVTLTSSRRLVLHNIKTASQGMFHCSAKIWNRKASNNYFHLTVHGRPFISTPIKASIAISSAQTISYGSVANFKSISWYTNGEKITNNNLLRVDASYNLKILNPNPGLSGIYQIFYSNNAGISTQSFVLHVNTGHGSKLFGRSGTINFSTNTTQASGIKYATWLIQIPIVQPVLITIVRAPLCSADRITNIDLYEGSTAAGIWSGQYCGSIGDQLEVRGPFVTVILVTGNFNTSDFVVQFAIKPEGNISNPVHSHLITFALTTTTTPTRTPPILSSTSTAKSTSKLTSSTARHSSTSTGKTAKSSSVQSSSGKAPTTKVTVRSTQGGAVNTSKGKKSPIGAIIGGVAGFLLIIGILVGVFCYRRKTAKKTPSSDLERSGKDEINFENSENTYIRSAFMENGGKQAPLSYSVHPTARSIPDVVPSHHVEDGPLPYEMGYLGPEFETSENQMYETVGGVIEDDNFNNAVIGNKAYIPTKPPKQDIGRRIASGPGLPYSKCLTPGMNQRPVDLALPNPPSTCGKGSDNDYLSPVNVRPLPSPSGSNNSKASSICSSPYYHMLETGENLTYESADDVKDDISKLGNIDRNVSDKSENRYAPLGDDNWSTKENTVYEPLTMERNKISPSRDSKDGQTGQPLVTKQAKDFHKTQKLASNAVVNQTDTNDSLGDYCDPCDDVNGDYCDPCDDVNGDYCDPCDDVNGDYCDPCDDVEGDYCDPESDSPTTQNDDENVYCDPYESVNEFSPEDCADAMYQPLTDGDKQNGQICNSYETLEEVRERLDQIPPHQPLTMSTTPSMDEDLYAEI